MTTGRRVLIVEDDPLSLELATVLLESSGWEVRSAMNGEEGVVAARRDPPDLVILDIGLPGMDGHATMRALRAEPFGAGLTIVALTAQAMRGDAEHALATGFDGYFTKPLDTRRLPGQLDDVMKRKRD